MKKFILKYFLMFLFFGSAAWFIWKIFNYPLTGIDDANIFFVYAKNLSAGHGFVYNIGSARVEGFTSLLWVLLCALAFRFSNKPELTLLIFNISVVSLGATVFLSYLQSNLFIETRSNYTKFLWAFLSLLLLLLSPNYILWNTIVLMENAIWGTLLLVLTILVVQEEIPSQLINFGFIPLSILLLMTRPESFLWVAVFAVILLVRKTLTLGFSQALKVMTPSLLAIGVTILSLTVFRLLYFGYPLPNTFYAKVSPSLVYDLSQGTRYFIKYFFSDPLVWLLVITVLLAGVHTILTLTERKFTDNGLLFLPFIAGISLCLPIITGGDHFGSFRFYQNSYPILLLCSLYCVKTVLPSYMPLGSITNVSPRSRLVFITSLGLAVFSSYLLYQARIWKSYYENSNMAVEFDNAKEGRERGTFIQEMFTPLNSSLPRIGVIIAGGVKYTYSGEVVDLMGLNNLPMSHNGGNRIGLKNHAAFEKTTFYKLQPDIVDPHVVVGEDWHYDAESLEKCWQNATAFKGLYDDVTFQKLYTYAKVENENTGSKGALIGWFRNDFLKTLTSNGGYIIESYEYDLD